jgi:phosphatidylinositol alpha-1,6-mannosyltransferase
MEAIRTAANSAGVAERVHLLGRIGETPLRRLLAAGDLFVMPNIPVAGDMEGFGVVMLEAGLAGLPAVASDLEGIRDVVLEGVSGHLVPALDAAAFADCIRRYDVDREALSRLAASARDHVRRTFTWPAVADQYVGVLERLVGSSTPAGTAAAGVGLQDARTEARFSTL